MKVELNETQKYRKNLVLRCVNGEMSTLDAAIEAGFVRRTIQKDIEKYKAKGDLAFVHGNKGKKKNICSKQKTRKEIERIFKYTRVDGENPFKEISYSYFKTVLWEEFGIKASVSWVKTILNDLGYKTAQHHRCKKGKPEHLFRERKAHTGELIQADGTPYDWFYKGKKYCIQGFVDDATGYPVGLYMTKNECLLGYQEAFRNMADDYGIPESLYPDKAGVFFVNRKCDDEEKHLTQFGLMMDKLGVDMFPANSPQAKGRIERFWQTIQHRLPILFRLRGVKTIEAANKFLKKDFPKIYKNWFPVEPKSNETHFIKADMNEVCSILKATFPGHTDKGGVFLLKGYKFFCPELPNSKILINMNEKEGVWVTPFSDSSKRHEVKLIETDTSGDMPDVMQDLIERVFLKNAKPRFREVYIDIDDVILSQVRPKKIA